MLMGYIHILENSQYLVGIFEFDYEIMYDMLKLKDIHRENIILNYLRKGLEYSVHNSGVVKTKTRNLQTKYDHVQNMTFIGDTIPVSILLF